MCRADGPTKGCGDLPPDTLSFDGFDRFTTGGLRYLSPGNGELVASTGTTYENSTLGLIRQTTSTATTALVRDPSGQVIAQRSASDKQFYITDQLGSTLALVSDAGAQVRSLRYDPDGTATTNTGAGPAALITSAQGQGVNGQYYFGARYYDPNTAAWTQQDLLNQVSDLLQANRYAYVGGDPINSFDPTGLFGIGDVVDGVKKTISEIDRPGQIQQAWQCGTELGKLSQGRKTGPGQCDPIELPTGDDVDAAY